MDRLKQKNDSLNRMAFDSFLFGFYALIPALVLIPPAFVPSLTGRILTPMYVVVIFVFFIRVFFKQYIFRINNSGSALLILFCLFVYYCLTLIFADTSLSFVDFFAYVVMPLLITCLLPISVINVFRAIIILPAPGILVWNKIFEMGGYYEEALALGTCYAFLVPVLASFIYLFYFFKDDSFFLKVVILLCIAINAVYLFQLVTHGSRGPLLSLLILPLILFSVTIRNEGLGVKVYKVRFFVILVSVALLVFFFLPAVIGLDSYLGSRGVEIQALNKIIMLNDQMDISNGRTDLANMTIAAIPERLLFGHGLSTSESVIKIQYPHNCILQVLFDGGLFLFLFLLVPISKKLLMFFRHCNRYQYALFLLFFLSAFPGALLSGDMWKNPRFWFFVGLILSFNYSNYPNNKKRINV